MTIKTIAVLGHVDHGKTSLVKALTGTDTDTLQEERERGLTISLGFAYYRSEAGTLNLIDAPGHADFLRTTISALSGIDTILLAVSATEGIQAQTLEHLCAAKRMGICNVIVAITKSDLNTAPAHNDLAAEVEILLSANAFSESKIIPCSVHSATGLAALKHALDDFLKAPAKHIALPGFYLPIDRVFSHTGTGTIVTGTLLGQPIFKDQAATLHPSETSTSVRGLQVNGNAVDSAQIGTRVAVNLRGVSVDDISKGYVLSDNDVFASSAQFDVLLDGQTDSPALLQHMETVTVLYGTHHAAARIRYFDRANPEQDHAVYAQLQFAKPQTAYTGQRFVLHRPATAQIAAGGIIVDPVAASVRRNKPHHINVLKAAANSDLLRITHAITARDGGLAIIDDVSRLSNCKASKIEHTIQNDFEITETGFVFCKTALTATGTQILEHLTRQHEQHPLRPFVATDHINQTMRSTHPAIFNRAVELLEAAGQIKVNANHIACEAHDPLAMLSPEQRTRLDALECDLKTAGLNAIRYDTTQDATNHTDLIELLIHERRAIRLYNHALRQVLIVHTSTVESAHTALRSAFPQRTLFTTSDARKALDTNRKMIVPLLEHLDRQHLTVRNGNSRYVEAQTSHQQRNI